MNIKIKDIMVTPVVKTVAHKTVGHARRVMQRHRIHALPIVNGDEEPIGIVTATDLVGDLDDSTPLAKVMTRDLRTIPQYNDVHEAARSMRNHHIHHLLVTHEGAIVGILSSFDLLKLIEDRRYRSKNAPTTSRHKRRHRVQGVTSLPDEGKDEEDDD